MDIETFIFLSKITITRMAKDLGCSQSHLASIIKKRTRPSQELAKKIVEYSKSSVSEKEIFAEDTDTLQVFMEKYSLDRTTKRIKDSSIYLDQINEKQYRIFGNKFVDANLLDAQITKEHQENILSYMKNPKGALVIAGGSADLRSYIASSIMAWILKEFNTFWYFTDSDLISDIQYGFDKKRDLNDILNRMLSPNFLILKEIGFLSPSCYRIPGYEEPSPINILFRVLDRLHNSTQPAIITTKYVEQEFEHRFGDRCSWRLFNTKRFPPHNMIIDLGHDPDLDYFMPL